MDDAHNSPAAMLRHWIPDAWIPGLTKLCRPDAGHTHGIEDCPASNRGKRPLHKGFNTAAIDRYAKAAEPHGARVIEEHAAEAEGWLADGYNVGLVPPLGVVVLDCDTLAAVEWVVDRISDRRVLPAIQARKDGEKVHFWFRYDPELLPLRAKQLHFHAMPPLDEVSGPPQPEELCIIDLRVGGRSQAVVAPSQHLSGEHYAWQEKLPETPADLPELPAAIVSALESMLGLNQPRSGGGPGSADPRVGVLAADGTWSPPAGGDASRAGHDRLRGYVNRLCRYASGQDPARAIAQIRERAVGFAEDLYAGRPDAAARLAAMLGTGGELDRLILSGWERFGARAPLLEDRTDQGYVDTLVATHGDVWRYAVERGAWLEWTPSEGRWTQTWEELLLRVVGGLHAVLLEDALREVDGERRERLLLMSRQLRNSGKVRSIVGRLRAECAIADAELDRDPWLLACPGGMVRGEWVPAVVLDLASVGRSEGAGGAGGVTTREPRPGDYITRTMGAPWVPDARAPEWHRFLLDVAPDAALRAWLARACGLSCVGEVLEHLFLFLFGPGGTGKSTFLGAVFAAFGSYAVRCDFRTFAEDPRRSGSTASPDVARLRGARLAVCSEIPDRTHLGARMKDLTGGDRVVARHLYGREIEWTPSHTVWIAGNAEPSAEFADTGVWRRMRQIPFDRVHSEADGTMDPTLPLRLCAPEELAGIVRWVVDGWVAYRQAGGLGTCPAVARATAEFRERLDPLAEWLEECCELRADASCGSGDAWASFQAWTSRRAGAGGAHARVAVSQRKFAFLLREHGVETEKGTKGRRVLRGMALLGTAPTEGARARSGLLSL